MVVLDKALKKRIVIECQGCDIRLGVGVEDVKETIFRDYIECPICHKRKFFKKSLKLKKYIAQNGNEHIGNI